MPFILKAFMMLGDTWERVLARESHSDYGVAFFVDIYVRKINESIEMLFEKIKVVYKVAYKLIL